jgi:hypothetical protein
MGASFFDQALQQNFYKTAFEQFNALFKTSGSGQLAAEFDKCRRKGRTSRVRALQLRNRLVPTPSGRERHGKQCFNLWIIAAPSRPLQDIDRLALSILCQQRASKNPRGRDIAAVRLQHVRGKTLCLIGALHLQGNICLFKRLIGGARLFRP